MNSAKLFAALIMLSSLPLLLRAHEGTGRGGHKESPETWEAELESYFGRHGYYHFGFGVQTALGKQHKLGLITHLAREDSHSDPVSSLGAEYGLQRDGIELEAFSFGYFPAGGQHAWAVGLRAAKEFSLAERLTLSPFLGPTFAHVRAVDEATETSVDVSHTMLFGGVIIEVDPIEVIIFGSQSFFSRSTRGLESHVDLEEMTHLAVYENNDGLACNSLGGEVRWRCHEKLAIATRYAAIFFVGESVRHSVVFSPVWRITERLEIFGGVQFLRGGPGNNDIGFGGVSCRF